VRITIPSSTGQGTYTIHTARDGAMVCTCRAWKFSRNHPQRRVCRHMRVAQQQLLEHIANAAY
jgi:hypothetical protein